MPARAVAVALLAFLLCTSGGHAQESKVSFGALVGADIADQAGEDVFAPHDRPGFIGGASAALRLAPRWSLQLDALYVQKGGRENNDNDAGDPNDDELFLEYLELPLLLKFSFAETGTRPEVYVGPSFAFELSCTFDRYPNGNSSPVACADDGRQTRPVDVGIAFGIDVEIPLGSGALVIDGRGVVGLESFDDSDAGLDYKNRILALMVGYRFRL